MLNAIEPGSIMPIHRHHGSTETVVVLRGKIQWVFYDNDGNETERFTLDANGEPRMLNVEKDRWHSLVCLGSGSVNEVVSPDGYFENNRYYDMIMMTKLKK